MIASGSFLNVTVAVMGMADKVRAWRLLVTNKEASFHGEGTNHQSCLRRLLARTR